MVDQGMPFQVPLPLLAFSKALFSKLCVLSMLSFSSKLCRPGTTFLLLSPLYRSSVCPSKLCLPSFSTSVSKRLPTTYLFLSLNDLNNWLVFKCYMINRITRCDMKQTCLQFDVFFVLPRVHEHCSVILC